MRENDGVLLEIQRQGASTRASGGAEEGKETLTTNSAAAGEHASDGFTLAERPDEAV